MFVVYAHRGASEYYPENTVSSFAAGVDMGANGIETDVQISKDGVLMIYHDDSTEEKIGFKGSIADYTYDELRAARMKNEKYGREDVLITFEDFLKYFGWRDLTLAIELKVRGIAAKVIEMLKKYGAYEKSVITSFYYDALEEARAYDKNVKIGWLYVHHRPDTVEKLHAIGAAQACPKAQDIKKEHLDELYAEGFECRAWGVTNTEIMKYATDIGVNAGMTVNFPNKLIKYLASKEN